MANLEALFDHEVDKKKIEEKARNEYFHKVHAQTHKFAIILILFNIGKGLSSLTKLN